MQLQHKPKTIGSDWTKQSTHSGDSHYKITQKKISVTQFNGRKQDNAFDSYLSNTWNLEIENYSVSVFLKNYF